LTEAQTAIEQLRMQVEQMKAAAVEATDRIRKESDDRIQALTAEKQQSAAALTEAQTAIEQLRLQVEQMKAAAVEATDRIRDESADRIQALTTEKQQSAAALTEAQTAIEQLRLQVEQMKAAAVEAKDRILKESDDRIQALTAEKEQSAAALTEAQTAMEQLRLQVEQMKAAAVEDHGQDTSRENDDRIQALTAEKEQSAAALTEAQTALEQLRQDFEQTKTAGVEAEQFIKEKETSPCDRADAPAGTGRRVEPAESAVSRNSRQTDGHPS
jgi:chromosome segregation ATPase